jgi:hypothetical protein
MLCGKENFARTETEKVDRMSRLERQIALVLRDEVGQRPNNKMTPMNRGGMVVPNVCRLLVFSKLLPTLRSMSLESGFP